MEEENDENPRVFEADSIDMSKQNLQLNANDNEDAPNEPLIDDLTIQHEGFSSEIFQLDNPTSKIDRDVQTDWSFHPTDLIDFFKSSGAEYDELKTDGEQNQTQHTGHSVEQKGESVSPTGSNEKDMTTKLSADDQKEIITAAVTITATTSPAKLVQQASSSASIMSGSSGRAAVPAPAQQATSAERRISTTELATTLRRTSQASELKSGHSSKSRKTNATSRASSKIPVYPRPYIDDEFGLPVDDDDDDEEGGGFENFDDFEGGDEEFDEDLVDDAASSEFGSDLKSGKISRVEGDQKLSKFGANRDDQLQNALQAGMLPALDHPSIFAGAGADAAFGQQLGIASPQQLSDMLARLRQQQQEIAGETSQRPYMKCEFCGELTKPLPAESAQKTSTEDMASQYCCGKFRQLIDFALDQEAKIKEFGLPEHIERQHMKSAAAAANKAREQKINQLKQEAKNRSKKKLQERLLARQQAAMLQAQTQQAAEAKQGSLKRQMIQPIGTAADNSRQLRIINYQLSNLQCAQEGWTLRPISPDLEQMAEMQGVMDHAVRKKRPDDEASGGGMFEWDVENGATRILECWRRLFGLSHMEHLHLDSAIHRVSKFGAAGGAAGTPGGQITQRCAIGGSGGVKISDYNVSQIFLEKFYWNGKKFLIFYANGAGNIYYPSGNLAIQLIPHFDPDKTASSTTDRATADHDLSASLRGGIGGGGGGGVQMMTQSSISSANYQQLQKTTPGMPLGAVALQNASFASSISQHSQGNDSANAAQLTAGAVVPSGLVGLDDSGVAAPVESVGQQPASLLPIQTQPTSSTTQTTTGGPPTRSSSASKDHLSSHHTQTTHAQTGGSGGQHHSAQTAVPSSHLPPPLQLHHRLFSHVTCVIYPDHNHKTSPPSHDRKKGGVMTNKHGADKEEKRKLLAVIDTNGSGTFYHGNSGAIHVNYNRWIGMELDEKGRRQRMWSWSGQHPTQHEHCHAAPPFQPICFQLNRQIGVRICNLDNIQVHFFASSGGDSVDIVQPGFLPQQAKLNVGGWNTQNWPVYSQENKRRAVHAATMDMRKLEHELDVFRTRIRQLCERSEAFLRYPNRHQSLLTAMAAASSSSGHTVSSILHQQSVNSSAVFVGGAVANIAGGISGEAVAQSMISQRSMLHTSMSGADNNAVSGRRTATNSALKPLNSVKKISQQSAIIPPSASATTAH